MGDEHSNSRSTLMFNTGAFLLSSAAFAVAIILDVLRGQMGFSTIIFMGLYAGLGVLPFRAAWKGFKDMDYSKASFRGYLAWLAAAGTSALVFLT